MTERKEAIAYCLTLKDVYEDYPFHDPNWCVMRHSKNRKVFALIFERNGSIWINVKVRSRVERLLAGDFSLCHSGLPHEQGALEFHYTGWNGAGEGDQADDCGEL